MAIQQITIRIPRRTSATGPFTLEWYAWRNGSLQGVRPRKRTMPAEPLPAGPTLADLRAYLHGACSAASIQTCGQRLHDAVCGGPWKKLWSELPADFRLYLQIEDPALSEIPWEIWNDGLPLALQNARTIVRSTAKQPQPAPSLEPRPWRILILVGVGPGARDAIGARDEALALKRHLLQFDHSFDCVLVDAGRQAINDFNDLTTLFATERPDIFHFIGHGESTAADSGLMIHSSQGVWRWGTAAIELTLRNSRSRLRLAYLNACRTALGGNLGAPMSAASVSEAFLRAGTLAVVAMQADVQGKMAATSAQKFYEELAANQTIDQALQVGRARLGSLGPDAFLPALTTSVAVETALPPRPPMTPARVFAVQRCPHMTAVRGSRADDKEPEAMFLDRHPDRRRIIEGLLRSDSSGRSYSAALLEGPRDAGKTWFTWWLLRMCAWQRVPAFYAVPPKVQRAEDCNWLEYVRAICRGNPDLGALAPPLPDSAVWQFYWDLDRIAKGMEPPYGSPPGPFPDPGVSRHAMLAVNELELKVLASFHNALKATAGTSAGGAKVLLICDQWRNHLGVGEEDFASLKRGLFDPVAQDPAGPVRVIITQPEPASADRYQHAIFDHNWLRDSIGPFDFKNAGELMIEFLERNFPGPSTAEFQSWNPKSSPIYPREFVQFALRTLETRGGQ